MVLHAAFGRRYAAAMSTTVELGPAHRRRLREIWRSSGWPCRDAIEVELLVAGWLERKWDGEGRETLRVTDRGVAALAETLAHNRARRDAHEALVARVAMAMQRDGRLVWRGLSLRAPLSTDDGGTRWVMAMPDVYSIRHTTVEDYVEPAVHEIKVQRSDLLADLRRPDKGAAYRALAGQCWYVLREGIAQPEEVPPQYGVMLADARDLAVARPAPRRSVTLPFSAWMALARTGALATDDAQDQPRL